MDWFLHDTGLRHERVTEIGLEHETANLLTGCNLPKLVFLNSKQTLSLRRISRRVEIN